MSGVTNFIGDILAALKGWGGYTTTAAILALYWKGIPPIIKVVSDTLDSWSKRRDGFEGRMRQLLADADTRYNAAEARHDECMQGQTNLRSEMREQAKLHDAEKRAQNDTLDKVYRMLGEMRREHERDRSEWMDERASLRRQLSQYQDTIPSLARRIGADETAESIERMKDNPDGLV